MQTECSKTEKCTSLQESWCHSFCSCREINEVCVGRYCSVSGGISEKLQLLTWEGEKPNTPGHWEACQINLCDKCLSVFTCIIDWVLSLFCSENRITSLHYKLPNSFSEIQTSLQGLWCTCFRNGTVRLGLGDVKWLYRIKHKCFWWTEAQSGIQRGALRTEVERL